MSGPVRRLRAIAPRCAALAIAFFGALATAQPYTTPPPPAAPRPLAIAAPSEAKLANGLRVIVARRGDRQRARRGRRRRRRVRLRGRERTGERERDRGAAGSELCEAADRQAHFLATSSWR